MPITYTFQQDECPSFGGASLSNARMSTILAMDKYVRSQKNAFISSSDIQNNVEHNANDTRSLISVMRKLNLINLPERSGIIASQFYTNNGDAYIHTLRALLELIKMQKVFPDAYKATYRSLQLILQEGIWDHYKTKDNTSFGISIILNIIGKTKTLNLDEYCFALSETIVNSNYNFETITKNILNNREKNVVYSFKKKRLSTKKDNTGKRIEYEDENFDTILQSTREILQQAGILEDKIKDCKLRDSNFFIKHELPYE